ncbi:MAG: guanine deaminase [Proteobacteria bacterium]|nr:guanine deaminase [Pseudomonadota bacterium]
MKWAYFLKNSFIFLLCTLFNLTYADKLYVRGSALHFLSDPDLSSTSQSYQYLADALLVINDGKIEQIGNWNELNTKLPANAKIVEYKNGLILPGFIDAHIHYPQMDMIAANSGGHLLQWLDSYTFPFEKKFQDNLYAKEVANAFLDELLRNGTTSAMIFTTIYPEAVNSLFESAEKRQMRIIAGEVMGDQNLPDFLIQSPEIAAKETEALIAKWHNKRDARTLYAITFRFAPTTSDKLFKKIEALKKKYPDTYIYSHISENQQEIKWSNELHNSKLYLDIYDRYNLLGNKTLLAHGVYLTDLEEKRIHETETSIAFCPTSNLFLGSGLFNLMQADKNGVTVGLGTDVGAGTSFSMLQTMNDAYKIAQLQNQNLSPLKAFYLATLGSAKALNLANKLGNFSKNKEADFVVLNFSGATPLLKRRLAYANTLQDKLFVLMTLGDDRSVIATYVNGKLAYRQD